MPKLLNRPFVIEARTDEERRCIVQGARIYLKNMKAGIGTAKGLDDAETADKWEKTAEHLEQGLIPRLNEQTEAFTDGVGTGLPLLEEAQEEARQEAGVGA